MTLEFKLFTRSTCSLCDAMEAELAPYIEKYAIVVHRTYIDNQPDLETRYGTRVPVLELNEKPVCEYFLDSEKLHKLINNDG